MCNHLHKRLGRLDYKTGLAPESCLDCGKNLGEIPASFKATLEYCNQKKISVHFPRESPPEDLVLFSNLKIDKQRF